MDNVRNQEGFWINSNIFREAAIHFQKYGYYISAPWGSMDWFNYWNEERRRCIEGYESGGCKITGDHYFYLNYCPILKTEDKNTRKSKKITDFPDFWDGDYNYFWVRSLARDGILDSLGNVSIEKKDQILNLPEQEKLLQLKTLYDTLGLTVKVKPYALEGGYNLIVGKSRRKGYQQPHSEVVMTPNGPSTMGKIKVGDEVLTPTGKSKVLEKYPQGECDVYEIELFDGRKVKCGLEHLWKIYSSSFRLNYRQEKVVDTKFLLNSDLKTKKGYKWFLPINEKVKYEEKILPIPAYTLGCILGDGNVSKQFKISGIDEEVFEYCLKDLENFYNGGKYIIGSIYAANKMFIFDCTTEVRDVYKIKYNTSRFANRVNPVYEELKILGLNCTSNNKYIPEVYKYGSIEQRYALVKGLMDTDGGITKTGTCSFANVSKRLVEDLQEVLYSLGITSTLRKRKDGLYIIYVNSSKDIFNLTRKKDRLHIRQEHRNFIPIVKVTKLDYQEESSCILINSEEHLYLTNNYIVTHNSYKNSSIGVNNYLTKPGAATYYTAYEKKYLYPAKTAIFTMTTNCLDFINDNTAWNMPSDYINKQEHRKASYKEYKNGIEVEKGFKSELIAITFKDNADAMRGKDAIDVIVEESGAFGTPGLLKACYAATEDCVKDGAIKTGMITIFGTSGDLEGGTADYAEMFMSPERFGLLPFEDTWEDEEGFEIAGSQGFFHPAQWNLPGYYDKQGNSDLVNAKKSILQEKQLKVSKGATATDISKFNQERPTKAREAFAYTSASIFPTQELQRQLDIIKSKNWHVLKGQPVVMYRDPETGKVTAEPDLKNELEPIRSYEYTCSERGAPVIYEYPIPNAPKGLYKIGYDPVRQDSGTSLSSIIVYKGYMSGSFTKNCIVAEYVGRTETSNETHYIAELFAELYNTQVMYENEVPDVKTYFLQRKKLHLLALQPDAVISKNIKSSTVNRVYGCHMNLPLKDASEKYVNDWLRQVEDYDESNKSVGVINRIYSSRFLEEAIRYNRKENFDLMSAFFMCIIQVQEEVLGKDYKKETVAHKSATKLLEMMRSNMSGLTSTIR